jgi:hypothetical protein
MGPRSYWPRVFRRVAPYRGRMDEIGLEFVTPGTPPPHDVVTRLREELPFDVELRSGEVLVTGADFETMRRHLSVALNDPEIGSWLRRGW